MSLLKRFNNSDIRIAETRKVNHASLKRTNSTNSDIRIAETRKVNRASLKRTNTYRGKFDNWF